MDSFRVSFKASTIGLEAAILACREASDKLTQQAEYAAVEGYYFSAQILAQESVELDKVINQLQEEWAKIRSNMLLDIECQARREGLGSS